MVDGLAPGACLGVLALIKNPSGVYKTYFHDFHFCLGTFRSGQSLLTIFLQKRVPSG